MSIEAIMPVSGSEMLTPVQPAEPAARSGFESILSSLEGLNTQMVSNQQAVAELALGRTDNLHQVMMNLEQTRLGFELLLAVRNKALDAYQELMRMQV